MSLKKGGVTLICPSSINFTAVFLSFLSKGMETSVDSLKIRKMEKKKYEKDNNIRPSKKKRTKKEIDDIALPIWLQ